jgi:hypothetical protein
MLHQSAPFHVTSETPWPRRPQPTLVFELSSNPVSSTVASWGRMETRFEVLDDLRAPRAPACSSVTGSSSPCSTRSSVVAPSTTPSSSPPFFLPLRDDLPPGLHGVEPALRELRFPTAGEEEASSVPGTPGGVAAASGSMSCAATGVPMLAAKRTDALAEPAPSGSADERSDLHK